MRAAVAVLLVCIASACGQQRDASELTPRKPAVNGRVIYVSRSGNDTNSGLAPDQPRKTIAAAKKLLRSGMGDQLLLKRGETWDEAVGSWPYRGQAIDAPLVLGAYGTGARPMVRSGPDTAVNIDGGWPNQDFLAIVGIHFQAQRSGREDATAIRWSMGSKGGLIEDCVIEGYRDGVTLLGGEKVAAGDWTISDLTVRRNIIIDQFSTAAHSQGLFASAIHGLTIEENIFDHNGWKAGVAPADMFNHNVYITTSCTDVTFRNNISLRASSHGAQIRPGGVVSGNFMAGCPIGMLVGNNGEVPCSARVVDNVVILGTDMNADPRAYGIDLLPSLRNFTAASNIIACPISPHPGRPLSVGAGASSGKIQGTVVVAWPGGVDNKGTDVQVTGSDLRPTYTGDKLSLDAIVADARAGKTSAADLIATVRRMLNLTPPSTRPSIP